MGNLTGRLSSHTSETTVAPIKLRQQRLLTEERVREIVRELTTPEQLATSLGDDFVRSRMYGRCVECDRVHPSSKDV